MIRPRVDDRIEGALKLQPMTVEQLAKCLMLDTGTVRKHARALRYQRRVSARQHLPAPNGRPWVVYALRSAKAVA
jgi:predicted ArsR family transcriptional regulator